MLVDKESGEIFLYQPVGARFENGITAEGVLEALDAIGSSKRAVVRLNCPGGSVNDGIAIYNALKRHPGGCDVINDSIAASIASVIALAGENRLSAKGSRWMIHRGMMLAMGNINSMQQVMDQLRNCDQSIVDLYSTVMKKSPEEILAAMDRETWYTGAEAIEVGLSTGMDDEDAAAPNVADWFKNPPANLFREAGNITIEPPVPVPVLRQSASLRLRAGI